MTRPSILARNRANAQLSTGPRTPAGKEMSRKNALRHGLTASPAAGIVESPARFERLLVLVARAINPANAIESALVHRIATSIWRLQRAARIDAAITTQAVSDVRTPSGDVEYWMARILDRWRLEVRELPEPDKELRRFGKKVRFVPIRPDVADVAAFRDKIMWNGAAITAMMTLIESLAGYLDRTPSGFNSERCEQLSCLLGDPYGFPIDENATYPDLYPCATKIQRLIGTARNRPKGEQTPPELVQIINRRLDLLDHKRRTCSDPWHQGTWERYQAAAMLPEDKLLERLIRYESHNDRALSRARETLAKLRGATVERLAASLTTTMPGGAELQVSGERTQWQPLPR